MDETLDMDWPTQFMDEITIELDDPSDELYNCNEEDIPITVRAIDEKDQQLCDEFFKEACCVLLCNTPAVLSRDLIIEHRQQMQELQKEEVDLVILSDLKSHRRKEQLRNVYADRIKRTPSISETENGKTISRIKYYFADVEICRKTYLFMHDVGKKRYNNLVKHFKENGIVSRKHKLSNTSRSWGKTVSPEDIKFIVGFIKNFGDKNGTPLPGRLPQFKNFNVIKLPSNVTKTSVWSKYCQISNGKSVARSTFLGIWNKYCPFVEIVKPASGLFHDANGKVEKLSKGKRPAKREKSA